MEVQHPLLDFYLLAINSKKGVGVGYMEFLRHLEFESLITPNWSVLIAPPP